MDKNGKICVEWMKMLTHYSQLKNIKIMVFDYIYSNDETELFLFYSQRCKSSRMFYEILVFQYINNNTKYELNTCSTNEKKNEFFF